MDMCIWICAAERFHYNQVRTGEENSHFWCSWVMDCDESSEPIPCLLSPCTEPGSGLGLRPFQLLLLQNGLVWFKINLGFPLLLPPPAFLGTKCCAQCWYFRAPAMPANLLRAGFEAASPKPEPIFWLFSSLLLDRFTKGELQPGAVLPV